jgi:Domain of unknown function (DUF4157)
MNKQQTQTTDVPAHVPLVARPQNLLQRKCDCGQHTIGGGACDKCSQKKQSLQRSATAGGQDCEAAPTVVHEVLSSQGQPLDTATRDFMESRFSHDFSQVQAHSLSPQKAEAGLTVGPTNDRFEQEADKAAERLEQSTGHDGTGQSTFFNGYDFSRVRVHTDARAAESARAIGAQAYTVGNDVVFGAGRFAPATREGRRLIAHELTHVLQQSTQVNRKVVQRCPDAATDTVYDTKATEIKAHAEYGKLPPVPNDTQPGAKSTVDKIIVDAKPKSNCLYYMEKLKALLDTPEAAPAAISAQTQAETVQEAAKEQKRITVPEEKARLDLEKKAVASGVFTKRPGKFGGNYEVDARNPANILVKSRIFLEKKGTGTDTDVQSIKDMKDAIEKAASTQGYIIHIEFLAAADPDAFKVDVDPSGWPVATNWAGGGPERFAHELHHLMAFPLDRYDYIKSHSTNQAMKISNRVHWFGQELTKPAGYNNPTSILATGQNRPNDDDVCTVAGLTVTTCTTDRQNARKAFDEMFKAYVTYDERILNTITKYLKKDVDTMMSILRELFRRILGLPEVKKNILKKLDSKTDTLAKVFEQLTAAQQKELRDLITP